MFTEWLVPVSRSLDSALVAEVGVGEVRWICPQPCPARTMREYTVGPAIGRFRLVAYVSHRLVE